MKMRSYFVPIFSILLLLFLITLMAGFFDQKIAPDLLATQSFDIGQAIETSHTVSKVIETVPASVAAKHATIISPRVMARITSVHTNAGDTVSKGQILVELEKADLTAAAQQATAKIEGISARLREATLNQKRIKQLHKDGLVAVAELDKVRAAQEMLEADLSTAKQTLQAAEASLSYTTIRSPIDGRVVDRFAEPGDTAAPGAKLLSVYNPFLLRVEANVREKLALSLTDAQQLVVSIPALDKTVVAEIEEIVPAIEPGSRSFLIKASIDYQKELLPGMYAQLQIPAGEEERLLIPSDRIAREGQLSMIWVVDGELPSKRLIRIGRKVNNTHTEVISGLNAGEKILPLP